MRKNIKGITLIALVITIIVLLILAGVSINLLLGENGLITKAREGSESFKKAKMQEKIELMLADYKAEQILDGKLLTDYLNENGIEYNIDNETGKVIITEDGYMMTIDPITLERDEIEKATKMAQINLASKVVALNGDLDVTLKFGEDIDLVKTKYAFVAKGNTELTKENITTALPAYATANGVKIVTIENLDTTHVGTYELYLSVEYKDGKDPIVKKIEIVVGVPVTSITLNKTETSIAIGEGETLTATIEPTNASIPDVVWTSSDTTKATVNENGVITGVGSTNGGTVKITANATDGSGVKAECEVEVYKIAVTGVTLKEGTEVITSKTITRGNSFTLTAEVSPDNATNKNITWNSNKTNVATVNNGVVSAIATGTVTITATSNDDNTKKATCTVTVNPIRVTSVQLNKTSTTVYMGATETLTATVNPNSADNKAITWTSSDETVATVTSGTITPKKEGTTTITATSNDDNTKKATCSVTVKYPTASVGSSTHTEGTLSYTWEEINNVARAISLNYEQAKTNSNITQITKNTKEVTLTLDKTYKIGVGDLIELKHATNSNTKYTVRVLGFNADPLSPSTTASNQYGDGKTHTYAGISMEFVTFLETRRVHSSNTNAGGWGSCEMRTRLNNTWLNNLENKNYIKYVTKKYQPKSNTDTTTCEDRLWLLAGAEIFEYKNATRTNWPNRDESSQGQYKYYKDIVGSYTRALGSSYSYPGLAKPSTSNSQCWWTRSIVSDGSIHFCLLNSTDAASSNPTNANGVAPGFCI